MNFPFVVEASLHDRHLERYRRHIDSGASGWHRRFTESIWRRHQHPSNARLSGWQSEADQKRRLIHFYDEYQMKGRDFVLRNLYLHANWSLPGEHIAEYLAAIEDGLVAGEWKAAPRAGDISIFRRGDLAVRLAEQRFHPADERNCKLPPPGYRNLDVVICTEGYPLPEGWDERPFNVFHRVGLRKVLARGRPQIVEPEALAEFLPAQLELGCGPSIEAGIPHLSSLHRIYGVSLPDYGFIFRARDDGLLHFFANPEAKLREFTAIYRACLLAESTPFYDRLAELWRRGLFVGPVITNNFDCQAAALDLPEISLRRYDWGPYYPTIEHHPRAKSLLVVGVHADRRLVQMRARERGLRVLFIDPEEYVAPDGRRIAYPVEAPQDADLFVRATAQEAMARLFATL